MKNIICGILIVMIIIPLIDVIKALRKVIISDFDICFNSVFSTPLFVSLILFSFILGAFLSIFRDITIKK